MKLLERFVEAVELAAAALSYIADKDPDTAPDTTKPHDATAEESKKSAHTAEEDPPPAESPVEPRKYPLPDDRDAWLILCRDKGIEVPERTRTATLVKQVMAYDIANPAGPETLVKTEDDPFKVAAASTVGTDVDPFAQQDGADLAPVTREELLPFAQKLAKEKGNPVVFAILAQFNVKKFLDLPEDKNAEALKYIKEALNG